MTYRVLKTVSNPKRKYTSLHHSSTHQMSQSKTLIKASQKTKSMLSLKRIAISITFLLGLLVVIPQLSAQTYQTRVGHVYVKSSNRVLDVEADNYQVYSSVDAATGEVLFTGLIKSFEMKLGAVDRVFNSGKVDVSGYPKFRFEGKIKNIKDLDLDKPGTYVTNVKGILYIGDEKRVTSATGRIIVNSSVSMQIESEFLMTIEEKNMKKINKLMKERLPTTLGIDPSILGISRDIFLKLKGYYKKR